MLHIDISISPAIQRRSCFGVEVKIGLAGVSFEVLVLYLLVCTIMSSVILPACSHASVAQNPGVVL
jgi:hypothetical protein